MLSEETLALVQNVMGPVGAVLASVMFLSSIPVMRYIIGTKSVGEYSCFPYVVQTCNCALWTTYSITYWQGGKMLWPLLTNGLGFVIASVSFLIYVCYSGKDERLLMLRNYSLVLLATVGFCVYALVTMTPAAAVIAGDLCLVINMVMYLGPCAGIRAAVTTRSTEFLPLSLGVSTITCSLPWFFFGVAIANLTVWLPNACGIVFGTVQVIVYVCISRAPSPMIESITNSVLNPKLQPFATAGDIFSFMEGSKSDGRTLRAVQTWAGSPLCMLAGEEGDAEAPRPRANSEPIQAVTPKGLPETKVAEKVTADALSPALTSTDASTAEALS